MHTYLHYLAAGAHRAPPAGVVGLLGSMIAALGGFVAVFASFRRSSKVKVKAFASLDRVIERNQIEFGQVIARLKSLDSGLTRNLDNTPNGSTARRPENADLASTNPRASLSYSADPLDNTPVEIDAAIDFRRPSHQVHRALKREIYLKSLSYSRLQQLRRKLQMSQTEALFRHARLAFYSFLAVSAASAAVLLYGAYAALTGADGSAIIVALSSTVPAGISWGLYRLSGTAQRRADEAYMTLAREVDHEVNVSRMLAISTLVTDQDTQEAIHTLSALRVAFPGETAESLTELLNAIRARPEPEQVEQAPDTYDVKEVEETRE